MKTAIITGAGSGIGRATALKLAERDYAVALAGRTRATLEQVAGEITACFSGAPAPLVIVADVSKAGDVAALVDRAFERWSRIDVLVNNAGQAPSIPVHEVTPEQWHEILDTNLSSAFFATRAVWPIMQRQSPAGGTIINTSSMAAKDPFPGLGVYGVAKAGLNMLTLASAREGDAVGIRVIGIAPAAVDTAMFRGVMGGQKVDPGQVLAPEDIADAIADAIEGSLRYCSGETIYVHRRAT